MRLSHRTLAAVAGLLLILSIGAIPAQAGHPDPSCVKSVGHAQVQCHGTNINMDTGSWKTDSAGHA